MSTSMNLNPDEFWKAVSSQPAATAPRQTIFVDVSVSQTGFKLRLTQLMPDGSRRRAFTLQDVSTSQSVATEKAQSLCRALRAGRQLDPSQWVAATDTPKKPLTPDAVDSLLTNTPAPTTTPATPAKPPVDDTSCPF